jgi:ribonuclease P protein component
MKKGENLFHFPVKARIMPLEEKDLQVAFVAPKKRFRKAVLRNRQKRMLREAFRLSPHRPESNVGYAIVFFSVAPADADIAAFQKGMDKLLLQFKNHLNDHPRD